MWQQSFLAHLNCHPASVFCQTFEMPFDSWCAIPFLTWMVAVPLHMVGGSSSPLTRSSALWFWIWISLFLQSCAYLDSTSVLYTLVKCCAFFPWWATFLPTTFFLVLVKLCYLLAPLKTNKFLIFSPFRLSSVSFIVAHGGIVYSAFHLMLLALLFISFTLVSQ
jgi:hypothetical protein